MLYRACIYYSKTPNSKDADRFYTMYSETTTDRKTALELVESWIPKAYDNILLMYPGISFTIKKIGGCSYIRPSESIIGFTAVGGIYEVHKHETCRWTYKHFNIYKYSGKFIINDFNHSYLDTVYFTKETESEAFNKALDIVDQYANWPKYLRDHKFGNAISKEKYIEAQFK